MTSLAQARSLGRPSDLSGWNCSFMDNREGPMTEDEMALIEVIHMAHDGNFLRALEPAADC